MNESRTEVDYKREDLKKRERLEAGIQTPLLDNLQRIETYGSLTSDQVKLNIYEALMKMRREPYIIGMMGEPESGKTTLASELIRFSRTILEREKPDSALNRLRIKSFDFEDAQKSVAAQGFERDLREDSEKTHLHYQKSNEAFRAAIRNAMLPGSLLIVHSPGMIGRGEMDELANKTREFSDIKYEADFIFLTKGRGIEARAAKTRTAFKHDPRNRHEYLTLAGIELELDEGYASSISGGNIDAVRRFYKSEAQYFYRISRMIDLPEDYRARIESPAYFKSVSRRAYFIENYYAPWLFHKKFGTGRENVLIGRNNITDLATLYQDDLNSTNFFMKKGDEYNDVKWY